MLYIIILVKMKLYFNTFFCFYKLLNNLRCFKCIYNYNFNICHNYICIIKTLESQYQSSDGDTHLYFII